MAECEQCTTQKELMTIYNISKLISNAAELQKSLEDSLTVLKKDLHLQKCAIYTLDEDEILTIFAAIDRNRHQKMLSTFRLGEGATGVAAENKEPVVVENIHNDILF